MDAGGNDQWPGGNALAGGGEEIEEADGQRHSNQNDGASSGGMNDNLNDEGGGDDGSDGAINANYREYLDEHWGVKDYKEYHDVWNTTSLAKIERDDSSVTMSSVNCDAGILAGERVGQVLGRNTSVRKLVLHSFRDDLVEEPELRHVAQNEDDHDLLWEQESEAEFEGLMQGISRNRSVEGIAFDMCYLCNPKFLAAVSDFFVQNNNICSIKFSGCVLGDDGTRVLAAALEKRRNKRSLVSIFLQLGEYGSTDAIGQVVNALLGYINLKTMSFWCTELGTIGCAALEKVLGICKLEKMSVGCCGIDRDCSILLGDRIGRVRHLDLNQNPVDMVQLSSGLRNKSSTEVLYLNGCKINDEGVFELGDALSTNTTLKVLGLGNNPAISGAGWHGFAKCLGEGSMLKLQCLHIGMNKIDSVGIAALSAALVQNTTLRVLYLHGPGGYTQDKKVEWGTFALCLCNPYSALEELCLSCAGVDNEGAEALGDALAVNTTLKILHLGSNHQISDEGWAKFFSNLKNPDSALQDLRMPYSSIQKEGLSACADSLGRICALKKLNLTSARVATPEDWRGLTKLLRSPTSSLESLYLAYTNIDDDTVVAIAESLVGNRRLQVLELPTNEDPVSAPVCEAMMNVIWNKSSINATYMSNHTIRRPFTHAAKLPDDLSSAFKLQEIEDKKAVARHKILRHHLLKADGINVEGLVELDRKLLPRAIAWVGKENSEHSILFKLIRGVAHVFHLPAEKKVRVGGTKRKLES